MYLLDHKISVDIIKKLSKNTIVVFDEAHNIDDICIEAYTVHLNKRVIKNAEENVKYIKEKITTVSEANINSFQK